MSQHRPLRRLPPLQLVGRNDVVDEDEPPDGAVSSDEEVCLGRAYHYECGDGERVCDIGADVWTRLQPGDHHAPKRDADGVFVHGRTLGTLGCKYRHLAALLQTRARIRVAREITTRIAAVDSFMRDVKSVARDECSAWHRVADGGPIIATKLVCLPSICDDLRVHANQWSSLRHLVSNDANLRPFLPALRPQLDAVRCRLDWLVRSALWWTRRLIIVGLRVIAHCDTSQMHADTLWSILRALEDFNMMASSGPYPEISPVRFDAILLLIADERCVQAAAILHRCLVPPNTATTVMHASWWPLTESTDHGTDSTSDYDSGSRSSVSVSQLTCHAPPILAFSRAEHEYASRFLHVMSSATRLLPVADGQSGVRSTVKSVRWGDAGEAVCVQHAADRYVDLLWSRSTAQWMSALHGPAWMHIRRAQLPGSVRMPACMLTIARNIQHACLKDMLPAKSMNPLSILAQKLHVHASWAAWDEVFSASLASRTSDRGHGTPLADGQYSTHTAKLLRDAYAPLRSALELLGSQPVTTSSDSDASSDLLTSTLIRLRATADTSAIWCQTKAFHLLAACSLTSFLLVTHSDLQLLTDEMEVSLKACLYACPSNSHQGELPVSVKCQRLWQQTNCTAAQCQSFSGMMVRLFSESCMVQAVDFFREAMPVGRTWKMKWQTNWRPKPSSYMVDAIDTLIEPVLVGVSKLRPTAQLSIISMAVTAFGRAWVRFILQQRIRFSWQGALQLEQDVRVLRSWLHTNLAHSDDDLRSSVDQLDVLKYLSAAVSLLKLQPSPPEGMSGGPPSTSQQKFADNPRSLFYVAVDEGRAERIRIPSCSIKSGTVYAADGEAPSIVNERNSPCPTNGSVELDSYEIPNRDQWLALRVHGGAIMWPKFTSCFNIS